MSPELVCSHCGNRWFYKGNKPVTSCSRCGWRIRVFYPDREEPSQEPQDNTPDYFGGKGKPSQPFF